MFNKRSSPAVGSKNCAFYDKRMKLGTLAAHIFFKKFRYRAIQISHVINMAAFFKKGVAFLHLTLINL